VPKEPTPIACWAQLATIVWVRYSSFLLRYNRLRLVLLMQCPSVDARLESLLDNLATAPLGITEDESFRISIAGAQEKTALLRCNGSWCKPRGTTPTTHIFKPSIGKLPNGVDLTSSVENEYLCLKLLNALGLGKEHCNSGCHHHHGAIRRLLLFVPRDVWRSSPVYGSFRIRYQD
jgi:HipA-like C-terminal domain